MAAEQCAVAHVLPCLREKAGSEDVVLLVVGQNFRKFSLLASFLGSLAVAIDRKALLGLENLSEKYWLTHAARRTAHGAVRGWRKRAVSS